nr:MAG TPA: hypothetical protein [Caudoviricetes sp.]
MDSLNTVIIFWILVSLEAVRRRSVTKRLSKIKSSDPRTSKQK